MLAYDRTVLNRCFTAQEEWLVTELRTRLNQVELLIERLSPHMRAQQVAPLRRLGAPEPALSGEAVEALQRLQAAATALRAGIAQLSRAKRN